MGYMLSAACGCNTGKRRRNNEDNFYFDGKFLPEQNSGTGGVLTCRCDLAGGPADFAVLDGMGGHADGQAASHLAAAVFADAVRRGSQAHEQFLTQTVREMSDAVWRKADAEYNDMGTTAAILRFTDNTFYLANVGDSRIFLFRGGVLQQISHDHTDEEFMRNMGITGRKPRLTQYVGVPPQEILVEPYLIRGGIAPLDQFLLCSDGLTDMVDNQTIASVLSAQADAAWKVNELIRLALENGGKDNVTVILVQVVSMDANGQPVRPQAVRQSMSAPAAPGYKGEASAPEDVRKGGGSGRIVALVAAAAILVAAALIFAAVRNSGKESENAQEAATAGDAATSQGGIQVEPSQIDSVSPQDEKNTEDQINRVLEGGFPGSAVEDASTDEIGDETDTDNEGADDGNSTDTRTEESESLPHNTVTEPIGNSSGQEVPSEKQWETKPADTQRKE